MNMRHPGHCSFYSDISADIEEDPSYAEAAHMYASAENDDLIEPEPKKSE